MPSPDTRAIWDFLGGLCADLEPHEGTAADSTSLTPQQVAISGLERFGHFVGAHVGSLYLGEAATGFQLAGRLGERDLPAELPGLEETGAPRAPGGQERRKGSRPGSSSRSSRRVAKKPPALMQWASKELEPLFIENVSKFRAERGLPKLTSGSDILGRGCIVIPLVSQKRRVGVINLAGLRGAPPSADTLSGQALLHAATLLATSLRVTARLGKLEGLASRDGLTGLLNYATLYDFLAREVLRAQRYDAPLSLILIDLDHFKGINDRYGHLAGDQILMDVSDRIREALRATDLPARYGGDEFAVILPQTDEAGAHHVAQRIRENMLSVPFHYLSAPIPVTISVGVGELEPGMTAVDLVSKADSFLYKAKHAGRNRVASG